MRFQSQGSPPAGCHGGGRAGGEGGRWADGQLHPLIHRRHKGESRGPAKNPNWLESLRKKRGAPSLHPSTPCQGSSAKKVVSCRVCFRFNPCKNQLRSTRGDLVRALLEVSEGFCYCNQTPNVPIPFCWKSEVIYILLIILRRSQELPSLCTPYICLCSSVRHHAAGNSSGGYRPRLGKKHTHGGSPLCFCTPQMSHGKKARLPISADQNQCSYSICSHPHLGSCPSQTQVAMHPRKTENSKTRQSGKNVWFVPPRNNPVLPQARSSTLSQRLHSSFSSCSVCPSHMALFFMCHSY